MREISQNTLITILCVLVMIGSLGYVLYEYQELRDTNAQLRAQSATDREVAAELQGINARMREENNQLADALRREQDRLRELAEEVEEITGTVGVLERLQELDPELLQKYSRVFFLNEHYMPSDLTQLDEDYTHNGREEYIHDDVEPFLEDLLDDAHDDDIAISVLSAFRSFDEQRDVNVGYTITYGSGANQFSAEQGYSEHQLGTTVDFTTPELNGTLEGFDMTPAYAWLVENAHEYGFTLSYPEGNAYYIFEPWHWRFVGEELAEDLYDEGQYFYDIDQRVLDEYLIEIFE